MVTMTLIGVDRTTREYQTWHLGHCEFGQSSQEPQNTIPGVAAPEGGPSGSRASELVEGVVDIWMLRRWSVRRH